MKIRSILLAFLVGAAAAYAAHLYAPPRWLPWKPLILADQPNMLTHWKLLVLADAPQTCRRVLADAQVQFESIADADTGPACGFDNAGKYAPKLATFKPDTAPRLACPMAAAFELWLRDVVQPAAQKHFGKSVARVVHFGTYSCRNIAGSSRRSEHAFANAVDVAAFELSGGKAISVLRDWSRAGSAEAAFLHDVRDGACDLFSVTLGPDYNAAHHDHLHLDLGLAQRCQ